MTECSNGTIINFPMRRGVAGLPAADTDRLIAVAGEFLRQIGYHDLTIRGVARSAGVRLATAYDCFPSKPHLVAEVFSRRVEHCCEGEVSGGDGGERLAHVVAELATLMSRDPSLVAAARLAVLSHDSDVQRVWARAGRAIRNRIAEALGGSKSDEVVDLITMAVTGEMMKAGRAAGSYEDMAVRLNACLQLLAL